MMTYTDAIKAAGSRTALMALFRAIGISINRQSVQRWKNNNAIPVRRELELQVNYPHIFGSAKRKIAK